MSDQAGQLSYIANLEIEVKELKGIVEKIEKEVEYFKGHDSLCAVGELLRDNILELLAETKDGNK